MLLTMNKYSMKDAKDIQNTCFKLNSLQLQTLLAGYLYATNEPHIPSVSTSATLPLLLRLCCLPCFTSQSNDAFWDKSLQDVCDIKRNSLQK